MKMLLYTIYASLDRHAGHSVLGWMDPEGRTLGRRRFVTGDDNLRREVAALGKAVFGQDGRGAFLGQIPDPEHGILLERLYRQFDGAGSLWLETGRQVRRLGRAFP